MKLERIIYDGIKLRAPAGFKEWMQNNKCGCGPGELGNKFVPNRILGISIEYACCIHDMMYRTCAEEEEKVLADLILFENAIRIIHQKSKNKLLSFFRAVIITWYFLSVFYGGDDAFGK